MKNKLFLILPFVLLLFSCGNKKAEERAEEIKKEGLSIPQEVSIVSAIGKIEPEQGLVSISSESGGIVSQILKNTGDSVSKGDAIVLLKADADKESEEVIQNQVRVQQKRAEADWASIAQYRAQLDEKNRDLAVSERLVRTGAETRQNVEIKKRERDVILANMSAANKNAAASQADISVLKAQLKQARTTTSGATIRSPQKGVIAAMDVKPGMAIVPLSSFATLAPSGKIVVHGEIDEMFASKVSLGNQVSVFYPGTGKVLASGKIIFLSPILEDKSLFYEQAGEQADRRVRRFKAELENAGNLLINEKVQCNIKVD